jgi:uncharacterized protein YcbK (DUF882 family)
MSATERIAAAPRGRRRAPAGRPLALLLAALLVTPLVWGAPALARGATGVERFAIAGPGRIKIRSTKNRFRFAGRYRRRDGRYIVRALRRINRVFDATYGRPADQVSLRLIEVLAFLQNELEGGWIVISSGYRSPEYNKKLRDRGGTVAKASLHQFGMAADLKLEGVKTKAAWRFARKHKVGGAGYYNSPWMHVDVGPVRFWTQGTANVRKGKSEHNKRIILVPHYDRYLAGETMQLRFARMTAFPIGVEPAFALERAVDGQWRAVKRVAADIGRSPRGCAQFEGIAEMARVRWTIPPELEPGRYRLRVSFCEIRWEAMPRSITSYEFSVTERP